MKISTKKYVDNEAKWLKKYFDAEVKSIRRAVDKVETTNTNYRAEANEWRGQVKDQTGTFVTRKELIGFLIAVVMAIIAVAAIYFK